MAGLAGMIMMQHAIHESSIIHSLLHGGSKCSRLACRVEVCVTECNGPIAKSQVLFFYQSTLFTTPSYLTSSTSITCKMSSQTHNSSAPGATPQKPNEPAGARLEQVQAMVGEF